MAVSLPPLLAPGLEVVFVGTEPGPESLRTGFYYANPANSFWADLHVVGLTPTRFAPSDFRRCLTFGIGLDDVFNDPAALRHRIAKAAPRAVCFNSKMAIERLIGEPVDPPWSGEDAAKWANFDGALVWALHDSSPKAQRYWPTRLQELRRLIGRIAAGPSQV